MGSRVSEADVRMSQDGMTALHLAASNGHIAAVEALLARGANLEAKDRWVRKRAWRVRLLAAAAPARQDSPL